MSCPQGLDIATAFFAISAFIAWTLTMCIRSKNQQDRKLLWAACSMLFTLVTWALLFWQIATSCPEASLFILATVLVCIITVGMIFQCIFNTNK